MPTVATEAAVDVDHGADSDQSDVSSGLKLCELARDCRHGSLGDRYEACAELRAQRCEFWLEVDRRVAGDGHELASRLEQIADPAHDDPPNVLDTGGKFHRQSHGWH